jgi:hypothetical protein
MNAKKVFLPAFFVATLFFLSSCKKENDPCSDGETFCSFIKNSEFDGTSSIINNFLINTDKDLPDAQKLEDLKEWFKCKSCVSSVEILCNSCIYTLPAQSELRIHFIVNGQKKELTADISMSNPLRFLRYHE